ncbi:MAG: TRAP transporter large permease, partial [Pseudomonadota bacterium]
AVGHLASAAYGMSAQYTWAVAPLFVLIGNLAGMGGITKEAFDTCKKWLGRLPGGLAMATVAASGAFAACCGSTVANAAIFTPLALPEMLRHGYDKRLSVGCIAAAGTFAAMIPPSISMVIYSMLTGEPLGQIMMAGIIPGLLTIVIYMIGIYIRVVRNPKIAPLAAYSTTWREKISSLRGTGGILIIFLVIMVGIYTGWFSPSAAGAAGACATLIIVFFRRKLSWSGLMNVSLDTALVTSTLFLIVIGGSLFTRFWMVSGIIPRLGEFVTGLPVPPMVIIAIFVFITLVLGCFLDSISVLVITLPLIHPIVVKLGYSGVWFAILMVKSVEIGVLTPPVGLNAFVVQAASGGKVQLEDVFAGITPFLLLEMITLILLMAFPQISLWLPNTMK